VGSFVVVTYLKIKRIQILFVLYLFKLTSCSSGLVNCTGWAKSPCAPARSVVNLYLYCVGSGKWFKKSHSYALGGVHDFCHITYYQNPPPPNSSLPSTIKFFLQVHRDFSLILYNVWKMGFEKCLFNCLFLFQFHLLWCKRKKKERMWLWNSLKQVSKDKMILNLQKGSEILSLSLERKNYVIVPYLPHYKHWL
jgi:hypothetical protein